MKDTTPIPCACGCGELLVPFDDRGRPRRYLPSHYSRVQPSQQEIVPCDNCGKPVRRAQWQMKRTSHTFCNQQCDGEYKAKHGLVRGENNGHFNSVTVPCAGCGAPVTKAHSLVYRRGNRVYCPDCQPPRGNAVSWKDYPAEFTRELRHSVRLRDNYTCQICGTEQGKGKAFQVHHIDYDKHNNDPMNLLTVCPSCHSRTNYGRKRWTEQLTALNRARFA